MSRKRKRPPGRGIWNGRSVAVSTAAGGTANSALGSSNGKLTEEHASQGWRPTCACYDARHCAAWPGHWKFVCALSGGGVWPAARSMLLDHFGGTGTLRLVAERLPRDSIHIELIPDYADKALSWVADDVLTRGRPQVVA